MLRNEKNISDVDLINLLLACHVLKVFVTFCYKLRLNYEFEDFLNILNNALNWSGSFMQY